MTPLILASNSKSRQNMLRNAGVTFESHPARVDEDAIRASLLAEDAKPRDIADTLAEFKARRCAEKNPGAFTLGSDQILALEGQVFSKPNDRAAAALQLAQLSGKTHHLYSAAVIYEDAKPVWRHTGSARMAMHTLTSAQINAYLDRAWPDVSSSVGAYHAEALGAQLFATIQGDWFSVLGMPLLEVLSYLRLRGMLET